MNYGYTDEEWKDIHDGKWNERYFDVAKRHIENDNIHFPHLFYLLKLVERQQKEINLLDGAIEEDDATKTRLVNIIDQYEEAFKYIDEAIYTQHCTMNHMENTEYEKGKISGLIAASNIVNKVKEKIFK